MNIIWRTQVIGIKIIGGKEKGVLGKIEMRNWLKYLKTFLLIIPYIHIYLFPSMERGNEKNEFKITSFWVNAFAALFV